MEWDEDAVVDLMRQQVEETLPHLDFDDFISRRTFHEAIDEANPTIFVADLAGEIVGYLFCTLNGYGFTSGKHVVQEVLYVAREHRGSRAAYRLVKEFVAWGKMLKAREIIFGISNQFQPERTARFFEAFGAERVGFFLKKYGD